MSAQRIRLRVLADSVVAIGPGKADLLTAIDSTGSISAAARSMGMSYRRAWLLVDTEHGLSFTSCHHREGGADGGGAHALIPRFSVYAPVSLVVFNTEKRGFRIGWSFLRLPDKA